MSNSLHNPAKIFSVQDANSSLPLVRLIASDMVTLSAELFERRRRLEVLAAGRPVGEGDLYADELAEIEKELARDEDRLQEFVDEISELGAETKSVSEGLIDFPAMFDGRLVYLCWKYNEPEVCHWHELDAGYAGRQRLRTTDRNPSGR